MKYRGKLDSDIGLFLGLAIGDAMGAPIEFQPSREPENYITRYMSGGAHDVSKGEFTDDTSMALAMADAFLEAKAFVGRLIMQNLVYETRARIFEEYNSFDSLGNSPEEKEKTVREIVDTNSMISNPSDYSDLISLDCDTIDLSDITMTTMVDPYILDTNQNTDVTMGLVST